MPPEAAEVTIRRILFRFHAACMAADRFGAQPTEPADAFYAAIAAIPTADPASRELAFRAFNQVITHVEGLPTERAFHPIVIAAEALAACLLRSAHYAGVTGDWARRDHPSARTSAARTYSKVADYDASKVDIDVLSDLAARLDRMRPLESEDEVTLGYVGRVAGKLRSAPGGIRLIEQLARQGPKSRVIAAYAIAFDVSQAPPAYHLSVFQGFGAVRLKADPPPRRLFWLFASLIHDADRDVAAAGQGALELIRQSWPAWWENLIHLRVPAGGAVDEPAVTLPAVEYPEAADVKGAIGPALADLRRRTGRDWTPEALTHLTHAQLARPKAAAAQPRGVDFALRFPGQSNAGQGVLTWTRDLMEQDAAAEGASEEPPRAKGAPRIFISYRWSHAIDDIGFIDFFAGHLFGKGYDIVFDRDPRHLDKGLSAGDVLLLLQGCTHFVPIVTEEILEQLSHPAPGPKSPLELEWQLARESARGERPVRWIGVWRSGDRLPEPLTADNVVDLREMSWEVLDRAFPVCRFQVVSVGRGGRRRKSEALERRDVRDAIAKARAEPGTASVEVHDVTDRGPAWSAERAPARKGNSPRATRRPKRRGTSLD